MRKKYSIFGFAVIAIIFAQIYYIKSVYDNYVLTETEYIDNAIIRSIDLELLLRNIINKQNIKFVEDIIPINKMPKEMLKSILEVNPPPQSPPEFKYDILKLIDDGIIGSSSEIDDHLLQDNYYEDGLPINPNILDSLLYDNLGRDYANKIIVMDSLDNILSSTGNSQIKYNYISNTKQIGFKKYQFLQIKVYFPVSNFIKQSILILVISLLIISIPIISLLLLLTTIRKKLKQLEISEQSINGIIHDLKSPLTNISTMLSWFKITEKDLKKKKAMESTSIGLHSLIKKVESLLHIARYNKKRIVVYKENKNIDTILEIIDLAKTNLLLSYDYKNIIININNKISSDKMLYIDIMHFDSIIRNIIENALKYSNNDINITITLDIDSESKLKLTVTDNGFGINKKHIKHLFKQFYRVPHEGKLIKGYGIGLSYVKAVAIAHGGSIRVQSTEGKGSEFEVILNIENR